MCFSFGGGCGPCRISRARVASGFLANRASIGLVLALTTGGLGKEAVTTRGADDGGTEDTLATITGKNRVVACCYA